MSIKKYNVSFYNDGCSVDNKIQNQFTAYIIQALKRRRQRCIKNINKIQNKEIQIDDFIDCYLINHSEYFLENSFNKLYDFNMLENSISLLKKEEQKIIYLYVYKNLKHKEIAERMNLSVASIQKKYQRILKKFRKHISHE